MTRGELALVVGAVFGVALTISGLGDRAEDDRGVAGDSVAVVDGNQITVADYERALATVRIDRRSEVDPELRRRILERLIDEELLVQRGQQLGLARTDRKLRNATSAAVIDLIVARGRGAADPDDAELAGFYANNRERFAFPERLAVRELYFTGDDAAARAAAVRVRLEAGADASEVMAASDKSPASIPTGALALGTLRNYLGAGAMASVLGLRPGEVTEPAPYSGGVRLLQLVELRPGALRPLDEVRDQVAAEYQRQAGEDRLRDFLSRQRRRARIVIAEDRL